MAGSFSDVQARKEAEIALRESEARLMDAQALAHVGSFTGTVKTGRRSRTDELYRIFGREVGVDPDGSIGLFAWY
ncbi:MAG: hypothetical protein HQ495_09630, partial [Alphaproteobacteria bacterium]|nr:hypothetical protein [Alphaproteobacteria bacterium]